MKAVALSSPAPLLVALGGAASYAQTPAARSVLSWGFDVRHAHGHPIDSRAVRLYAEPEYIELHVTTFNDGGGPLLLNYAAFQRAVRVTVRSESAGGDMPVEVTWEDAKLRSSDDSPMLTISASESSLVMPPNAGLGCVVRVRPRGGERFATGRYYLEVSMRDVAATVTTDSGERWNGTMAPAIFREITIGQPISAQERASMAHVEAREAIGAGDWQRALPLLQSANQADPNNLPLMANLGSVYLALNRYAEAAATFEKVLPRLSGRTGVPRQLALAYVGLGVENEAVRVLRRSGVAEDQIQAEIGPLRAEIRRRAAR